MKPKSFPKVHSQIEIRTLYALWGLREIAIGAFWSSWVAASLSEGNSLQEAAMGFFWFFISGALLDIPTGIYADRVGRKLATQIGFAMLGSGFLLRALSISSATSSIGFCLAGVGMTFISGAQAAWTIGVHQSAIGAKSVAEQKHLFFNLEVIARLGVFFGGYLGVWAITWGPTAPWWLMSGLLGLGLLFSTFVPEIKAQAHVEHVQVPSPKLIQIAISGAIPLIILGSAAFGVDSGVRSLIYQPHIMNLNQQSVWILGHFQSMMAVCRIIGIYTSKRITLNFSLNSKIVAYSSFITLYGVFQWLASRQSSLTHFCILFAFAGIFAGGFFPVKDTVVNQLIPEKSRATLLSVESALWRFGAAMGSLIVVYFSGGEAFSNFWNISAGTAVLAGVFNFLGRFRNSTEKSSQTSA